MSYGVTYVVTCGVYEKLKSILKRPNVYLHVIQYVTQMLNNYLFEHDGRVDEKYCALPKFDFSISEKINILNFLQNIRTHECKNKLMSDVIVEAKVNSKNMIHVQEFFDLLLSHVNHDEQQ